MEWADCSSVLSRDAGEEGAPGEREKTSVRGHLPRTDGGGDEGMRNRALPRSPASHAAMLDRVIAVTSVDPCFEALSGTCSLVSGGFDAESDLDSVSVAETDRYGEAMAERRVFAGRLGDSSASCTGEHVGEP
ncbi:hypothetical protein OY671_010223, partial [Metschnikowia pulcherrima]